MNLTDILLFGKAIVGGDSEGTQLNPIIGNGRASYLNHGVTEFVEYDLTDLLGMRLLRIGDYAEPIVTEKGAFAYILGARMDSTSYLIYASPDKGTGEFWDDGYAIYNETGDYIVWATRKDQADESGPVLIPRGVYLNNTDGSFDLTPWLLTVLTA